MANKKKQTSESNELDTPFLEELLVKLPLGYRFMIRSETMFIGELYKRVRFSSSFKHQSNQYTNIPSYKPLSNIIVLQEDEKEFVSE